MNLKEYLKTHCINQTKFALKAGVSRGTIEHILRGRVPTLHTIELIKEASEGKVKYEDYLEK